METFVFITIIAVGLLGWFVVNNTQPKRYRKKTVLTGGERDFYFRLCNALPECHVCPQVALSALVEPAGMGRLRQRAMSALGSKRVGFAIFDERMDLLAVVEVAHRSRPTRVERARQACFASAGIRTLRFLARRPPTEAKIRASVFERRTRKQGTPAELDIDKDLEFRKTPWRNTVNAHI